AGDAAARMGSRAAHVQSLERSTVVPVPEHRPRREQLIEAEGAVEDVTAHQTEGTLEVQRGEDLPTQDRRPEVRRMLVHQIDHDVRDLLAMRVPRGPAGPH